MAIRSTCGAVVPLDCACAANAIRLKHKNNQNGFKRFHRCITLMTFFDVFPDQLFVRRIAQQICRMKCRHEFNAMIARPIATQLDDRHFAIEQRLHGEFAQADDDVRTNDVNLLFQEWFAGGDFIRLGITVFRRPTFDHINDVNIFRRDPCPW